MDQGTSRRQPSERDKRFGEGLQSARQRRTIIDSTTGKRKRPSQVDIEDLVYDNIYGASEDRPMNQTPGATVSSWEQGRRAPKGKNLLVLRQVLDKLDPLNDEERELFAYALRRSGVGERQLYALLTPPLLSTFWSSTIAELVRACAKVDPPIHVLLYPHDEKPDFMLRDLVRLREYSDDLAGIAIAPASPGTDEDLSAKIAATLGALHGKGSVPIVQMDRFLKLPDGERAPYHFVGLADKECASMVVQELIKVGHLPERIVGVFDVLEQVTQARRRLGFINGLTDAGVDVEIAESAALAYASRLDMKRQTNENDWRAIGTLVENVLRRGPNERPTAVVAATSYIAREVQRVMQALDLERALASPRIHADIDTRPLIEEIRIVALDGAARPEFVREVNFIPYTPNWLAMTTLNLLRGPFLTTPQEIVLRKGIIRRTPLEPITTRFANAADKNTLSDSSPAIIPSRVKVTCHGRVCLVGEHLDAEMGGVLVAAIDREVVATASSRSVSSSEPSRVYGQGVRTPYEQDEPRHTSVHRMDFTPGSETKNESEHYVDGVIRYMCEESLIPSNWKYDLEIESSLPAQRGLGSSGALTVAIGLALISLQHMEQQRIPEQDGMIPRLDLAKHCKEAEVRVNSVLCGWMDQITPLFSEDGHVLWVDTSRERTPMTRRIPFPADWCFALLDADQTRELAAIGGKYNHLQREFHGALEWLHKRRDLLDFVVPDRLFDLDLMQLQDARTKGMPEHFAHIAEHALTERLRLERVVAVLGDVALETHPERRLAYLNTLADQMAASHRSLARYCKVSTRGLQYIVAIAGRASKSLKLHPGAKLVGAGYGGVVTCVIPTDLQTAFQAEVERLDQATRRQHPGAFHEWRSLRPIHVDFSTPTTGHILKYQNMA